MLHEDIKKTQVLRGDGWAVDETPGFFHESALGNIWAGSYLTDYHQLPRYYLWQCK